MSCAVSIPPVLVSVTTQLQFLDKGIYLSQFVRYLDALWTVGDTLAALDTMAGLSQFRNTPVVAYQESTASPAVVWVLLALVGQITLLDTPVVMGKYGRDIKSLRARHTLVALITGNGIQVVDVLGNVH